MDISLVLTNRTFVGLTTEIIDAYPPLFRLKSGSNAAVIGIPGRGYCSLNYSLAPTSLGRHQFGKLHVVTRDLAGLFFYERDIAPENTIEVTPRSREIARGSLSAVATSSYAGPTTSRRKGEGMEFADIREYVPGDPFKRIEWKATARRGMPMVRELHAETQLNVMILLEASETMAYGEAGQTKLDYSARAVASLLGYLSRRGDFFGLALIMGDRPTEVIPLGRGQVQMTRILTHLGSVAANPSGPKGLAQGISRALALGAIKGRTLFFIVTDLETEAYLHPLKWLLSMSHEVVIISPYTPFFEAHGLTGLERTIYSIHTSYQVQTRQKLVREAARLGIPLIDVGPKDLFPQLLARVEQLRHRGGS